MQHPSDEHEALRLKALQSYPTAGSINDSALDDLTMLTAELCAVPIALITLVDADRVWIKSSIGISISDIPRENSFSHYTIQQSGLLIISDILQDERFQASPWWALAPQIRFYAGIPLINPEGLAIGTLSVMDYSPRTLTMRQQSCLCALGRQTMMQMELKRCLSADDLLLSNDRQPTMPDTPGNTVQTKRLAQALQQVRQLAHQNLALKSACAQAERATQMKSIFLATMSHEIRTPMNAVLGMVNLLSETELNTEQQEFVETIRIGGQSLLALINDILEFSRLEAGKTRLETVEFDLHGCMDEVVDLMATTAYAKELELAVIVEPNVPSLLRGDVSRLRQVLINLVANAIKFTHEGEVTLSARLDAETEQTVILTFIVKDTGVGIPHASQAEVFQPFVQFNTVADRTYGGSGLGLAICKELVELMGGTIGFKSQEGQGSEFWFTLTLQKVADCNHLTTSGISSLSSTGLANQRILLIDTKTINYRVLQTYASLWSLQVDRVTSVSDALTILRQCQQWRCPYTLVIIDNTVPDAKTLPSQLGSDPQLARTPSVLMASLNQRDISKQYHQLGFSAYVLKPLKQSRVLNCLQAVLSNTHDSNTHVYRASLPETSMPEARVSLEPATPVSTELLHDTNSPSAELVPDMPPKNNHSSPDSKSAVAERVPIKILVVEDTPLNQKVILKLLKRLNYDCDLVENGQAALDALAKCKYDIVLMDCQMPILDGYSATQQLRQREQQADPHSTRRTVVIAMTAHAITGERDKCLDAGMDDYLSKPIFKESLAEKLDYWSRQILSHQGSYAPESSEAVATVLPVTSPDLIQWQHLQQVAEGDNEFAIELVQLFLKGNQPNLNVAREAIANRDLAKVRHIAHQIKGSASNVGLIGISQIADKLESQAQRDSVEGMEALVDELDTLFTQVQSLWQQ